MNVWQVVIAAFGLLLVIEGAVYFALPRQFRSVMQKVLDTNVETLRGIGICCVVIGLILLWIASAL